MPDSRIRPRDPRLRRPHRPGRTGGPISRLAALLVSAWLAGCQGPPDDPEPEASDAASTKETPAAESPADALAKGSVNIGKEPIGYYLSAMDNSVRAWSNLKLGARSNDDFRKLRILEQNLAWLALERSSELIEQVESGPPQNRAVAAILLGFAGTPEAQGPLLGALDDPEPEVVANALVGLGLLARADTPTSQMCFLLRSHPDEQTRNNAAYAIKRVCEAADGAPVGAEDVRTSCRLALGDAWAGVRTQGASVLGRMADGDSIPSLGDLLSDEENLVALSAARALREIGRRSPPHKGAAARALVGAFDHGERSRRDGIRRELIELAATDMGDDVEDWKEWAYRMP